MRRPRKVTTKTVALTVCVLLLGSVALAAPEAPGRADKPGKKGTAKVPEWAVAVFPSGAEFTLEIAATDEERALGYMFRQKIGARDGMLFLFGKPGTHSIWMKNCLVSLDLIWLDAQFNVVHIEHDRPPCPPDGACPGVAPMRLSHYVLEIAGGGAAEQGLKVGDTLTILSDPAIR